MNTKKNGPVYTRKNPPENDQKALDRLGTLRADIERIRVQLRHAQQSGFPNSDEYSLWRHSATAAMNWKKSEQTFLTNWLDRREHGRGAGSQTFDATVPYEPFGNVVLQLKKDIGYIQKYDAKNPPTFSKEIQARRDKLTETKRRIEATFNELKKLSFRLSRDPSVSYFIAKQEVNDILRAVDQELRVLSVAHVRLTTPRDERRKMPIAKVNGKLGGELGIQREIDEIKERLGWQRRGDAVGWLCDLLWDHRNVLELTPDEEDILQDIERWDDLTRKLRSANERFACLG